MFIILQQAMEHTLNWEFQTLESLLKIL